MKIIIIGAGGHGKVVREIVSAEGRHEAVGFVDSAPALVGKKVAGLPILGPANVLPRLRQQGIGGAIVAIGDARVRVMYAALLRQQGFELVNAIHPTASISASAILGKNIVVAPQAAICTEARLGDSVIANTSCVIDHECEIDAGVHVCPGAHLGGRVRVGERSWIGIGANVIQCLVIGRQAKIGAGAVVIRDVPDGVTVVGVPARIIATRQAGDEAPLHPIPMAS